MGLTKQYQRVEPSAVFGLVATHTSNVLFLNAGGRAARLVAVGACERVLVWDLRTKELVHKLMGERHEVTSLARSPNHSHLAVGYRDGYIRVFDLQSSEVEEPVVFCCHRRAVTALSYDHNGMRLAAGSQDTQVTVLDTVAHSGLCRLKGHTNEVTKVTFFKERDILITSSKDKLVKFWDLQLQHCFKTLVGHRTEVYSFVLLNNDHRLVTGCADSELRVWDITFENEMKEEDQDCPVLAKRPRQTDDSDEEDEEEGRFQPLSCESRGAVMREGREKVSRLVIDPAERFLLCHGPGKKCEVFVLATQEELQKKLKKRRKKAKRKAESEPEREEVAEPTLTLEDEVRRVNSFKLEGKLRGLDLVTTPEGHLKVAALLHNNTVQTTEVQMVDSHNVKCQDSTVIGRDGHRTEVRTLAFSSDSNLILSASAEELKLWNSSSIQCIRTMQCDYALCSTFVPGDRNVIIGTKSGKLQVFDVGSGSMVSSVNAHEDTVWSLSLAPKDQKGIITGSKDQTVKFWKFELVTTTQDKVDRKHLTLIHTRMLKMDDQITCVMYSPDQRLLAVALLDNTVKVFFVDTLKLFHTLYGGSAPVLCMDISSDSTIIATGSADKNIKLWGLDFGDLRKSLFAHDDSVSCVKFVPKTHLLFSAGKDRLVKQFDADKFCHILTLKGHHAEVRALAVSPCGQFMVTSSHDMSLRLWETTDSILVLEDEREMEREEEENEAIAQTHEPVVAGEDTTEVMAVRKNVETLKGAENLIENIDIYEEETKKLSTQSKEGAKPQPHPKMLAYRAESPADFVLKTLQRIRSSDLEQTLLSLPFQYVTKLLPILHLFLRNGLGWDPELCCHCVTFLLRIHHGQITANQVLMPTINRLRDLLQTRTQEMKDLVGFNLFAMKMVQLKLEEQKEIKLFADATARFKQKKKKRKVHAPVLS